MRSELKELLGQFLESVGLPASEENLSLAYRAASALFPSETPEFDFLLLPFLEQLYGRLEKRLEEVLNLGAFMNKAYELAAEPDPLTTTTIRLPTRHLVLPGSPEWKTLLASGATVDLSDEDRARLILASMAGWDALTEEATRLLQERRGISLGQPVHSPALSLLLDPDFLWAGGETELLPQAVAVALQAYRQHFLPTEELNLLYLGDVISPGTSIPLLATASADPWPTGSLLQPKVGDQTLPLRVYYQDRGTGLVLLIPEDRDRTRALLRELGIRPVTLAPEGSQGMYILAPGLGELRVVTDQGEGLGSVEGLRHGYCGAGVFDAQGRLVGLVAFGNGRPWQIPKTDSGALRQALENFASTYRVGFETYGFRTKEGR